TAVRNSAGRGHVAGAGARRGAASANAAPRRIERRQASLLERRRSRREPERMVEAEVPQRREYRQACGHGKRRQGGSATVDVRDEEMAGRGGGLLGGGGQ